MALPKRRTTRSTHPAPPRAVERADAELALAPTLVI